MCETMAGVNSVVTEEEILQMLTFLECVVLSPSLLYANKIIRTSVNILPLFTLVS